MDGVDGLDGLDGDDFWDFDTGTFEELMDNMGGYDASASDEMAFDIWFGPSSDFPGWGAGDADGYVNSSGDYEEVF